MHAQNHNIIIIMYECLRNRHSSVIMTVKKVKRGAMDNVKKMYAL